jgi:hypothetical protein
MEWIENEGESAFTFDGVDQDAKDALEQENFSRAVHVGGASSTMAGPLEGGPARSRLRFRILAVSLLVVPALALNVAYFVDKPYAFFPSLALFAFFALVVYFLVFWRPGWRGRPTSAARSRDPGRPPATSSIIRREAPADVA